MIQKVDNDGAETCQRLADRCFEKYVTHGGTGGAVLPPTLARLRLTAEERSRLRRQGCILRAAAPKAAINSPQPIRQIVGKLHPNYGRGAALAREYLSKPRFHGDMKRMADAAGLSYTGLSHAIAREQRKLLRGAA